MLDQLGKGLQHDSLGEADSGSKRWRHNDGLFRNQVRHVKTQRAAGNATNPVKKCVCDWLRFQILMDANTAVTDIPTASLNLTKLAL